jgi:putative peptidoglycan lipid II flippase
MAAMQVNRENKKPAGNQIARAAGTVMAAFVISNLIGLFAKTMTARTFGTGIESNAFFAANRFSEILFNLVAGGALGSAFIPVFTGMLINHDRDRAWKLASSISNLVSLVLVLLSLLTIIFSRQVVHYILAPGFTIEEEILTAQLLRIQILSSVIFGLSGLIMGILNSHKYFLLPAIAPAMYQIGWVAGIFLLVPKMGISGLAWGVVLGSFLHLIVQIPLLIKLPKRAYHLTFGLGLQEVRDVGRLMAPKLLGAAVVQLNFLLNTILASYQPDGSITAIGLAFPLMIMPEAAIAQSIAIAALPTFSEQVARRKLSEMRTSLAGSLRAALLLSIPAMVGLIVLRVPIVQVLYEGRQFGPESTRLVAWALLWYASGLVSHSIVEIISRAFYALQDTKTPVIVGVGAMSLNLLFSFLFTYIFKRIGWMPIGGLALANTTATTLEALLLLWLMRKKLQGLEGRKMMTSLLKVSLAGALMGAVVWFSQTRISISSTVGVLGVSILIGTIIYFILLLFLKVEAFQKFIILILNKTRRK